MSKELRLNSLNISSSYITNITLPETPTLTSVVLNSTLVSLSIDNAPNLTTLTLPSAVNLTKLDIGSNVGLSTTYPLINQCYTDNAPLTTLKARNISWVGITGEVIDYILNISTLYLTGSITTYEGSNPTITFDRKVAILAKFGNVDSSSNTLRMTYTQRAISSLNISGSMYTRVAGSSYQYKCTPQSIYANNFVSLSWLRNIVNASNITTDTYTGTATCSINSSTGLLTVTVIPTSGEDYTNVQCKATLIDGTVITGSRRVYLYDRQAVVGDYVYSDGDYSDQYDNSRTVVGVCIFAGIPSDTAVNNWDFYQGDFYTENNVKHYNKQYRLCVSTKNITLAGSDGTTDTNWSTLQWGLYPSESDNISGIGKYKFNLVDGVAVRQKFDGTDEDTDPDKDSLGNDKYTMELFHFENEETSSDVYDIASIANMEPQ